MTAHQHTDLAPQKASPTSAWWSELAGPFALVRYRPPAAPTQDEPQLGLLVDGCVRPLSPEDLGAADLHAFLGEGNAAWDRLVEVAERPAGDWLPASDVTFTAPVTPRQVLQTGANYRTHVIDLVVAGRRAEDDRSEEELRAWAGDLMDRRQREGIPYFFIGLPRCVVGDDAPLVLPASSDQHDWELELAVVIGRPAFRVSRQDAMSHVAGYTIVNDVTTRDLVFRQDMKEIGTDWFRAKNSPGFLPTGPALVPAPFVTDTNDLHVRLDLNGSTMQDASTSDLLFDVPALVAAASATIPLLPGDLLLTGSPAGNGVHWGRLLRDGDEMTGTITGLGTQTVRCIAEQAHE